KHQLQKPRRKAQQKQQTKAHGLKPVLLDGVAGTDVARVERFAASESFILAMVKADAILAKLPAEIDVLLVDDGREMEEARDEEGFEFLARALRFGEREEALRRFRSFVLLLFVVFICHRFSIPGIALSRQREQAGLRKAQGKKPVLLDASAK